MQRAVSEPEVIGAVGNFVQESGANPVEGLAIERLISDNGGAGQKSAPTGPSPPQCRRAAAAGGTPVTPLRDKHTSRHTGCGGDQTNTPFRYIFLQNLVY